MAEFEEKLNAILSDPQAMGQIASLAGWGVCRGAGRPVSNYTEDDTVFTACAGGTVTQTEAEIISKIASRVPGVVQVVRLFTIITPEELEKRQLIDSKLPQLHSAEVLSQSAVFFPTLR